MTLDSEILGPWRLRYAGNALRWVFRIAVLVGVVYLLCFATYVLCKVERRENEQRASGNRGADEELVSPTAAEEQKTKKMKPGVGLAGLFGGGKLGGVGGEAIERLAEEKEESGPDVKDTCTLQ
ncbi:hypothetical protein BDV96DRAFT_642859 [Lophiotrema nucula]|uniref:Uncharacterized protein n=1 Tax=Lophiotrema nucula TaxID=690887 RepID=A0A6A5ZJR2_9PLEO|nr:hypothetical protein BDV96DRAFT_642859 [Lophiotrema nucula]